MTKPQLARWRSRMSKADTELLNLHAILESTFEVCPEVPPTAGETRDEECERIAASCVRDALGALEGAKHALVEASVHMDWGHTKEVREFPMKARDFIGEILGYLPENRREEAALLLAMGRRAP